MIEKKHDNWTSKEGVKRISGSPCVMSFYRNSNSYDWSRPDYEEQDARTIDHFSHDEIEAIASLVTRKQIPFAPDTDITFHVYSSHVTIPERPNDYDSEHQKFVFFKHGNQSTRIDVRYRHEHKEDRGYIIDRYFLEKEIEELIKRR